jgi:hypothetical protein
MHLVILGSPPWICRGFKSTYISGIALGCLRLRFRDEVMELNGSASQAPNSSEALEVNTLLETGGHQLLRGKIDGYDVRYVATGMRTVSVTIVVQ